MASPNTMEWVAAGPRRWLLLLAAIRALPGSGLRLPGDPRWPLCFARVPASEGLSSCVLMNKNHWCAMNRIRNETDATGGRHGDCLRRRDTCALVGSSSHLLGAGFGAEIDRHQAVIRLNGAPAGTAGGTLIGDVGSKTTVRFVNHQGVFPYEEMGKNICVFLHTPQSSPCLVTKTCKVSSFRCRPFDNDTDLGATNSMGSNSVFLDFLHLPLAREIMRELGHSRAMPTAGLTALVHALHVCTEITVYGFGPSCQGVVGEHYFTDDRYKTNTRHLYNTELHTMMNLSNLTNVSATPLRRLRDWVQSKGVGVKLPQCLDRRSQ